ncbi:MAG: hypothetical protein Tsb0020_51050 [Haliangiales bacterium]
MVVAIIGILSSLAIYAYQKNVQKSRVTSEVNAIFSEFQIRQEEFHAENGAYLSTGAGEADRFPPGTPIADGDPPIDISPLIPADPGGGTTPPDQWARLRMTPRMSALRCAYVSIAGGSGDSFGPDASSFAGPVPPDSNWYYLLAECDTDGNGPPNSLYFSRSDITGLVVRNEGE